MHVAKLVATRPGYARLQVAPMAPKKPNGSKNSGSPGVIGRAAGNENGGYGAQPSPFRSDSDAAARHCRS